MCFSATASFTAGTALLVVGALTARRARRRTELPFALIPALFGVQQLIEGAIWLTLTADAPLLNTVLTYVYSLFSHVLWPVYVPVAVFLLEPTPWRRRVLAAIALAGAAVGLYLLYFLASLPIVSQIEGRHITYVSPHFYVVAVMVLYVLGACISMLFSSHKAVQLFGVAAFVAFVAAYSFYAMWLISVWCFFCGYHERDSISAFFSARAAKRRAIVKPAPRMKARTRSCFDPQARATQHGRQCTSIFFERRWRPLKPTPHRDQPTIAALVCKTRLLGGRLDMSSESKAHR